MKKYTNINDIQSVSEIITDAISLKSHPYQFKSLGENKTLVMLFFNSSLRTRLSTEKAAKNLGMDVMILNVNDAWNLEYEDGNSVCCLWHAHRTLTYTKLYTHVGILATFESCSLEFEV